MEKALGLNGEENMGDEFTIEKTKHKRGEKSSKGDGRRERSSSGQEDKSDNDRVTLFIKNISFSATEEDLEDHFPGATEVRWPSNHDGSKKGFAFIQFASEEDVDKAISELQGSELCGRALMLDYVGSKSKGGASGGDRGGDRGGRGRNGGRDREDRGGRDRDRDGGGRQSNAEAGRTRTLIVKNLSWNTDEDLLRDEFEGATSARIVMRDGKSAGFGFVDFEDEESCSNAYRNMHDAEIDGRSIKVDYAAERGSGGGGGGGRGGGRGGGMRGGRGGRGGYGGRGGRSGFGGGRGGRDGGGRGRGGGRGGGRRDGGGREYQGSRKSYD